MSDLHALIIDDDRYNREILAMFLEREAVTSTLVDALRSVPQVIHELSRIDVIFLDLEFPAGSGFHLLPDLRAEPRLKHVPVVAYSVHTSEIDMVRRAGFDGFLGKPLDIQRFPGQFGRIMRGEPVWEV